jgi:rhodanese-related sulfurtransferase
MKNLSLLLGVFIILISSCGTSAQDEEKSSSPEVQKVIIDLDVAEFKNKMSGKDVVILDVRTPAETAKGKIAGAIEIDVRSADFKEKIKELDQEKTYLVYCRSGKRSAAACNILEKEGFKEMYNLLGGYLEYSK